MDKSAAIGPFIAKNIPKVIRKGKNLKDWFLKGVRTNKKGQQFGPRRIDLTHPRGPRVYRGATPAEMTAAGTGGAILTGAAANSLKKESAFKDEWHKLGFWGSWGKKAKSAKDWGKPASQALRRTGGWLPFIGLSALVSGLGQSINMFIQKLMEAHSARKEKSMSKEYYKKMLESHPTLLKEDPELVAKYFTSLNHFSPHMSKDPLAAGAYIRQSLDRGLEELGGPSPDIVKNIADIEGQATQSAQRRGFMAPKLDVGGNPLSDVTRELVRYDVQHHPSYYGLPNRTNQTSLNFDN